MKKNKKMSEAKVFFIVLSTLAIVFVLSISALMHIIEEKENKLTEEKDAMLANTIYLQDDGSFFVRDGILQEKTSKSRKKFYFSKECSDCKYYQTTLREKYDEISYKMFENRAENSNIFEIIAEPFKKVDVEKKVSHLHNMRSESNGEMIYSYLIHLSNKEPDKFEDFLQEFFELKEHEIEDLFEISEEIGISSQTIVSFEEERENLRLLSAFFLDNQDQLEEMNTMSRFEK